MPKKAALTAERKQELATIVRSASAAAWHARGRIRYHLRLDDPLFKEVDDIYARLRAFETRVRKQLQLPIPTQLGFPSYAMRKDGTLPK
jgi:hypothetical protein